MNFEKHQREQAMRREFEAAYMIDRNYAPFVAYRIFKREAGQYVDYGIQRCFEGYALARRGQITGSA